MPPHILVQKSHLEDKLILGIFLLKGSKDKAQAQHMLQSESIRKLYADRNVGVCVEYGFDGWFVNVETDLGTASGANDFAGFQHYLREQIKFRVGSYALVIYYDPLGAAGEAAHQNALLAGNKAVSNACDGIFSNYRSSRSSSPTNGRLQCAAFLPSRTRSIGSHDAYRSN